jgi:hypothetical protein
MANLSPRQNRAIEALVSGASASVAASYAGVTPKQVYQWLKKPVFKQEIKDRNHEILESAVNHLTRAASDSVLLLQQAVRDPNQSMNIRIRAADMILTHLNSYKKLYELEDRLVQLELKITDAESNQ